MQKRWTRATQMIFMAAMLSGSAACNTISGADSITFVGSAAVGTTGGSGTDAVPSMGKIEQIRCKDNSVMVAVEGRYGSWIDSVSVICAELKDDGTLGTLKPSMEFGGPLSVNQSPYSSRCDPGQVVGALDYKHAKEHLIYILQVRVDCATVSDWKSSGQGSDFDYAGVNIIETVDKVPVSLTCKPGEIADGVDVLVGEDDMKIHVKSFDSLHCIKAPGP